MQVEPVALVAVNGYLVNGREADAQRCRHLSFSTPPVATAAPLGISAIALRRHDDRHDDDLVHVFSIQFSFASCDSTVSGIASAGISAKRKSLPGALADSDSQ